MPTSTQVPGSSATGQSDERTLGPGASMAKSNHELIHRNILYQITHLLNEIKVCQTKIIYKS